MFTAKNNDILNSLFEQARILCGNLNNYVSIIVRFMNQKHYWSPFIIDRIKGTFGIRESSHFKANHASETAGIDVKWRMLR